MAKLIEKDGKKYRIRRGKLVEIPPEWAGKTVRQQTKRRRKSMKKAAAEKPLSSWGLSDRYREKVKRKKRGLPADHGVGPKRRVIAEIVRGRHGHHKPEED